MSELPPNAYGTGLPSAFASAQRPEAVTWFKIYAAAMALLYAFVVLFAALVMFAGFLAEEIEPAEMAVIGVIIGGFGLVFLVAYAVALFLPQKPWVWVYDLILIAIGLTSCLTMIAAIPLLIFWIKPDTKAYFGRK